jgi:hypothetical protein
MAGVGCAALLLGVLALGCIPPEPPRDAGVLPEAAVVDVPIDILLSPPDVAGLPDVAECPTDCPRAVVCCRSDCSGPPVERGCCPCGPGEVDSLSCAPERTCALAADQGARQPAPLQRGTLMR